jgi:hypothetical protein
VTKFVAQHRDYFVKSISRCLTRMRELADIYDSACDALDTIDGIGPKSCGDGIKHA